jgi:hypothetical protein
MRRIVAVVLIVAAGCQSGSHRSAPTTTTARARAARLCRDTVPDPAKLVGSGATTVGDIRNTPIGTVGPTQYQQYPNLSPEHFAAWCWTRNADTFKVYKVAPGEKADLVVTETGMDPPADYGAPAVP